jgi:hypothetical protein
LFVINALLPQPISAEGRQKLSHPEIKDKPKSRGGSPYMERRFTIFVFDDTLSQ